MENRCYWYWPIKNVFKNTVSIIKAVEMGIPFCKYQGFSKLSPCYITNWEISLQNICYNC